MNVKTFKKLIKQAVSEAIQEELPVLLEEYMGNQNKPRLNENRTFNFTSDNVGALPGDVRAQLAAKMGLDMGYQQPKLQVVKGTDAEGNPVNPYLSFIADAAANMTAADRAGLGNLGEVE